MEMTRENYKKALERRTVESLLQSVDVKQRVLRYHGSSLPDEANQCIQYAKIINNRLQAELQARKKARKQES